LYSITEIIEIMKYFNLDHEVIISTNLRLTEENPVEGKEAEHTRVVTGLRFYQTTENRGIAQIYISKDFVTSLYDQIQEIEKEKVKETYFDTPF